MELVGLLFIGVPVSIGVMWLIITAIEKTENERDEDRTDNRKTRR